MSLLSIFIYVSALPYIIKMLKMPYIPVRGRIKEARWVISPGDIKISSSGVGVRQLAPFKAFY